MGKAALLLPLPLREGGRGEGAVGALGATQINHYFLPGALLARAMGRQDCLGATMMLRRQTLDRIGGFAALVNHLADDNVLGRLVQRLGLTVHLADTVPATTVGEATLGALWRHELRWARTIRALVPAQFAASALQYPVGMGASGDVRWRASPPGRWPGSRRRGWSALQQCAPQTGRWSLPIAHRSGFCPSASLCR